MSLWQAFHNVPGDPTVTSDYAWINAGHNNALADLGNKNFTVELYINLAASIGHDPTLISKGHTEYHAYHDYSGWQDASVDWGISLGSMYWPTGDHNGISMGVTVSGKYFTNGNWEYASMHLSAESHHQSWYIGNWRHIAFTAQRPDYSHWWDMIVYQDGYRASYDTTGNSYGLIRQGINDFSDINDDILMDIPSATPTLGQLPFAHQSMRLGWTRISDIARYPTTYIPGPVPYYLFTPTPRLTPPYSDANTLGLWYFNEGSGNISHNQQGDSARDAVIYDGIWDGNVLTLNI